MALRHSASVAWSRAYQCEYSHIYNITIYKAFIQFASETAGGPKPPPIPRILPSAILLTRAGLCPVPCRPPDALGASPIGVHMRSQGSRYASRTVPRPRAPRRGQAPARNASAPQTSRSFLFGPSTTPTCRAQASRTLCLRLSSSIRVVRTSHAVKAHHIPRRMGLSLNLRGDTHHECRIVAGAGFDPHVARGREVGVFVPGPAAMCHRMDRWRSPRVCGSNARRHLKAASIRRTPGPTHRPPICGRLRRQVRHAQ